MSALCNPARPTSLCALFFAAAAVLLLAPRAHAGPCAGELALEIPSKVEREFDPIRDALQLHQTITLRNTLERTCSAQVSVRVRDFSSNWPIEADLIIRDAAGRLLLRANPSDSIRRGDPFPLTLPPSETAALQLNIKLEHAGTLLRSGSYQAAIEVMPSPAKPVASDPSLIRSFSASFEIQPSVRIALSQDTLGTTISLGQLRPGQRQSFGVLVTATDAYSLSVRSHNQWRLERINGSQAPDERVPYHFIVDGERASEATAFQAMHARLPQGTRGHSFEVVTGDFGVVRHGKYQDVITVTIAARP